MRTDNTYIIGWLAAVLLLLTSCNADNQRPDVMSADLLAVGSAVEVSGGDSKNSIKVEANCGWTVTKPKEDSWIQFESPKDGKGSGSQDLIINVEASPLSTERTSKLTIRCTDGIERIVTVTQRAGDIVLNPDTLSITFTYEGGERPLSITSNTHWTATSSSTWLTINGEKEISADGNQRLTIHADANSKSGPVTGNIEFKDQDSRINPVIVTVVVGGRTPNLTVIPDEEQSITVPALGGVCTFAVKSNFNWQATLNIQPKDSWVHFENGEIYYSGNANNDFFPIELTLDSLPSQQKRTVVITFSTVSDGSNNLQVQRTIEQEAGTLPKISELTYDNVTDITHNSATITFQQSYDTFGITACGVRYSTSEDNVKNDKYEKGSVQDKPEINLKDLSPNTVYYVCAYATNAVGTQYSNVVSFQTRSVPGRDDHGNPDIE